LRKTSQYDSLPKNKFNHTMHMPKTEQLRKLSGGFDDQVRVHTPAEVNQKIDRDTEIRVHYYATQDVDTISKRIGELTQETDLERFLEANAATLTLFGVIMGVAYSRKWLLLPLVTGALLFNHAVRGSYPPVAMFRRLGVRTRSEIDREKYALKALRGDFENVHTEA
jgi:hypothetical protein